MEASGKRRAAMSATDQIVEDPVFRHRLRFEDTTDQQGAPGVLCEMWVDPGGGVPPHVHPRMEERFTVVEGRAEFLAGRRWVGADAGETVVVPAGTRHAYRNRGSVVAHVRCIATPPDPALEGFLTDAAALGRAGRISKHGIPKGIKGWLQGAVMIEAYGEMVEMGTPPLPPKPIQRLVLPPLARLARRRGYRAGQLG
jgi:mannose-6-phosphate isomerase-like protein (cupin superfamily)